MSIAVARVTREVRLTLRWTQRSLSSRSGVSQTEISKIERAHADSIDAADRVLTALGCRWQVVSPRVERRGGSADPAHARCSAYVRAHLESMGYAVHQEVEIGDGSARGWIDLLAFHPHRRILHLGEIKTELRDVGAAQRQIGWYEREALRAAARIGWRPVVVVVTLYLLMTEANDEAIRLNRAILAQSFPMRAGWLTRTLNAIEGARGRTPWALVLIDPLSRRREWLRSSPLEGRRSLARYRSYADFMARWRGHNRHGVGAQTAQSRTRSTG